MAIELAKLMRTVGHPKAYERPTGVSLESVADPDIPAEVAAGTGLRWGDQLVHGRPAGSQWFSSVVRLVMSGPEQIAHFHGTDRRSPCQSGWMPNRT
jgi:hypothetical protein